MNMKKNFWNLKTRDRKDDAQHESEYNPNGTLTLVSE